MTTSGEERVACVLKILSYTFTFTDTPPRCPLPAHRKNTKSPSSRHPLGHAPPSQPISFAEAINVRATTLWYLDIRTFHFYLSQPNQLYLSFSHHNSTSFIETIKLRATTSYRSCIWMSAPQWFKRLTI